MNLSPSLVRNIQACSWVSELLFFFCLIDADGSRRCLASFSPTVAFSLCVVLVEFYMEQR